MRALACTIVFLLPFTVAPAPLAPRAKKRLLRGNREKRVADEKRSTSKGASADGVSAKEDAWERSCALRARDGDRAAFQRLVECFTPRIYTHLYRLLGNREEAEDLTQETFLRVYRFFHRYDAARPFRNWVYAIATNAGLNALRAQRRRRGLMAKDAASKRDAASPHPNHDPRRRAMNSDVKERLAQAVSRLPARSALLVQLHYHEGMSIREAAEITGVKENAAKVALHRARKALREWLEEDMKDEL